MKSNVWTYLNGKRSIRGRMLWAFVLSLAIAITASTLATIYRPQVGFLYKFLPLAVLTLLFFICFLLMTRPIVRYFKSISLGLITIANGDLSYRLPVTREDELGIVAQNINQMAEQLQDKREHERQLEKSKMELITYVSHDLRTPLTSIIGYLDLLKNHAFQDQLEQERYIDNAYNKTQQLKKLIDDLFEYTRLTNGNAHLSLQEVDLIGLLEQVINEFEPVAREHKILIIKDFPALPTFVKMDIEKIVRAFDNLLMNALKFSISPGEIKLKLSVKNNQLLLAFENRGMPITHEQQAQLFDQFYKMEPSRNERNIPTGFGLGLSIVKNIIELHGGRIWLTHDAGKYIFYIEFPLQH